MLSSNGTDLMDLSMDYAINRASNRQSNRHSRADFGGGDPFARAMTAKHDMSMQFAMELRKMQASQREMEMENSADESQLLTSCDLYRQLKMETIKTEVNTISEMSIKEKQLRAH